MADLETVVVTGYGAWAKTEANPAAQILAGLKERPWDDCNLVALEVPVVSDELYGRVEDALLTHKPAVWMSIGVWPGSPLHPAGDDRHELALLRRTGQQRCQFERHLHRGRRAGSL